MKQQLKTLDEMTLEELTAALPLPPFDPNEEDPLMRLAALQVLGKKPDTAPPPATSSSD